MIEEILYLNPDHCLLMFLGRPPIEVSTDNGTAFALALQLLQRPEAPPEVSCTIILEAA